MRFRPFFFPEAVGNFCEGSRGTDSRAEEAVWKSYGSCGGSRGMYSRAEEHKIFVRRHKAGGYL